MSTSNSSGSLNFFTPEIQKEFWSELDPDLNLFIDYCKDQENWTYGYNELPETFVELASSLPKVANISVNSEQSKEIIHALIPLMSAMQYGPFLSSYAWLDNQTNDALGWGNLVYIECVALSDDKTHSLYLMAKNIVERINVGLEFDACCKLFTRGDLMLKLKAAQTIEV